MWVEPVFPVMFSFKMRHGQASDVLKDPSSVVLSSSVAKALFDNENPINKVVKLDNKESYKVTGVYEDLPRNSTLYKTQILLSWEKYATSEPWMKDAMTRWGNHSFQAFVELADKADFVKTTAKIKNASMVHLKESEDGKEELVLQPMDNWRLYNEFKNGKLAGGRIHFVWLFGIIGVFVLLLACINFMNLSTARSEKRAKEVGIRKTIGSLRKQLIKQFLTESVLVAFLALVLAILLVVLSLSFFNGLADKEISLPGANIQF